MHVFAIQSSIRETAFVWCNTDMLSNTRHCKNVSSFLSLNSTNEKHRKTVALLSLSSSQYVCKTCPSHALTP